MAWVRPTMAWPATRPQVPRPATGVQRARHQPTWWPLNGHDTVRYSGTRRGRSGRGRRRGISGALPPSQPPGGSRSSPARRRPSGPLIPPSRSWRGCGAGRRRSRGAPRPRRRGAGAARRRRSAASGHGSAGSGITARASSSRCSSWASPMAYTGALRARTSCTFEITFSASSPGGHRAITGNALVEQRDRPVLHLAGRVALGVQVRDLLELERALERERVERAAAEVEGVRGVLQLLGDGGDRVAAWSSALWRSYGSERARSSSPLPSPAPRAARSGEREREQRHELGGERLRRGDADLGSGVGEQRGVGQRAWPASRARCTPWRGGRRAPAPGASPRWCRRSRRTARCRPPACPEPTSGSR